ncbi:hypothetical protein CTAYLR_009812 [Chrysophaeum taylorii]|uniref:Transmembrane 9 superfamily member n=1 Tax=Chrysophaeum taylorii TaxID=2483200 RepID=A0AAD7U6A2_9STRA|nr:hypothetical protein CTAYLR_009812 [Chrysophaeum taylorii]
MRRDMWSSERNGEEDPASRRGLSHHRTRSWAYVLAVMLCSTAEAGSKNGPRYAPHEPLKLLANKVGPFNNPSETYEYYSLPFCSRSKKKRHEDFGERLVGNRKTVSPYEITFLDNVPWRLLCEQAFSRKELKMFTKAIENDYYFEMFIEDLPMWGYVGEVEGEDVLLGHLETVRRYVYPHLHFSIGYNGEQVVSVNVSTNPQRKVDITDEFDGTEVAFSYSVEWVPRPDLAWENRMSRYHDSRFLPGTFEIHWLSIINSFVLVLLLTAFLTIIMMRVLKNDFSRYMEVEEDEMGEDETGWKLINGDVFRFPPASNALCALVGAGAHLFCVTFLLLLCAVTNCFVPTKRGAILTAMIVLYALASPVAGFTSARLYRQLGGEAWLSNALLATLAFPVPLALVFVWVNSVALAHGSSAALPFVAIIIVVALFALVAFPLSIGGAILGRQMAVDFRAPCRTTRVPREIPAETPWYRLPPAQMFMAGFLPFSAIYIELHYIFASVWGHKIYTLFGILFLAFVMLVVVTAFITVSLIYFQLAREDYRWWWRSLLCGGATGAFIYAYSFFYFFNRSSMDGMIQGSFYFGYMAIISYAFFLMLGFIGFASSLAFVKHIYSVVKAD